ncbi:hypothetical protein H1Q59_03790 [Holosporaceae bacterium 'Namur']|nr:hypothetical protein [Holosporaceae bacterium 'Namur']
MKSSINFIKNPSSAFKLSKAICDAIYETYNKYHNTETTSKFSLESPGNFLGEKICDAINQFLNEQNILVDFQYELLKSLVERNITQDNIKSGSPNTYLSQFEKEQSQNYAYIQHFVVSISEISHKIKHAPEPDNDFINDTTTHILKRTKELLIAFSSHDSNMISILCWKQSSSIFNIEEQNVTASLQSLSESFKKAGSSLSIPHEKSSALSRY